MKGFFKNNYTSFAIILLNLFLGLYLFSSLPDQMATHWNFDGEPDKYSSKWIGIFLLPLSNLFCIFFLYFFIKYSPKNYQMKRSEKSVAMFNLAVTLLLMILQTGVLLASLNPERYQISNFIILGLAMFLLIGGNFMSKVERNFVLGIRTPWSVTSENNWRATHRFAARLMLFVSPFLIANGLFYSLNTKIALALFLFAMLIPIAFSLVYFLRYERQSN